MRNSHGVVFVGDLVGKCGYGEKNGRGMIGYFGLVLRKF